MVFSLIGGLLGQRSARRAAAQERAWALEDQAEQFVRLREAAEKGGFNPLAVLGASPNAGMVNPTQADRSNAFGSAIADFGLLLDQRRARTQELQAQAEANALRMQNTRLQKAIVRDKIRPTTPGIYQKPSEEITSGLLDKSPLDPRREVQATPVMSDGGHSYIDTVLGAFPVPTFNGELIGVGEAPIVAVAGGGAVAARAGGKMAELGAIGPVKPRRGWDDYYARNRARLARRNADKAKRAKVDAAQTYEWVSP